MTMLDWLAGHKTVERTSEEQAAVDEQTARLALYSTKFCPYCIKVRRAMEDLALDIVVKDTAHDAGARRELVEGGGASQVPCLRITREDGEVQWMYESDDIIVYLRERFG